MSNSEPVTDLTDKRFGLLTAVKPDGRDQWGQWFWVCECVCGNTTRSLVNNLSRGLSRSCGCQRGVKAAATRGTIAPGTRNNLKPPGEVGFRQVLNQYRANARNRGLAFELSEARFRELTQATCRYCDSPPSLVAKSTAAKTKESRDRSRYVYNGVDRVDNTLGYTEANVVPCCKICNYAKLRLSELEFLQWIDRLVAVRVSR
jgi:hypothetical protein